MNRQRQPGGSPLSPEEDRAWALKRLAEETYDLIRTVERYQDAVRAARKLYPEIRLSGSPVRADLMPYLILAEQAAHGVMRVTDDGEAG